MSQVQISGDDSHGPPLSVILFLPFVNRFMIFMVWLVWFTMFSLLFIVI
jgi:hypothetical protein